MNERRICLVTETYPPEINGVALTLARLASGLRARGHAVSIVCPRRSRPAEPDAGPDANVEMLQVRGVALPGYRQGRAGLPATRTLRGRWTTQRPDVVYVATEGPLGWSAVRTARQLRLPVFSGFHTRFHEYARHYGARVFAPAILRYLRRFHNRTQGTLVASSALRAELVASGFERVSVLGRGVNSDRFSPVHRSATLRAAWGVGDADLVALYIGRLAPEKNFPLAIAAYRAMQQVQATARLVVVGDGPLRPSLERMHRDLIFCGMRMGGQLAAHYASADVFLFPSETETFGNVTLEAMASGLCVVAYDYAAAGTHIVHGESGVLAPRGDSRAFVEHAAALARWSGDLSRMRRAARDHAAMIGWEEVVDAFERFLAGIAVDDRGPAAVEALTHTP
ncbi:MAG: hypothetical protein C5B48_06950 [Candidatus Rokuibacteriota bacterium]|nr:MAG: hypothetical protein C5B48_06950 [Candidatus Rokubacteria bacterium]